MSFAKYFLWLFYDGSIVKEIHETSMIEIFVITIQGFKKKSFITDDEQNSKYASIVYSKFVLY